MKKLLMNKHFLKMSLLLLAGVVSFLILTIYAPPVSAADVILTVDGTATGGYVGQQVELRTSAGGIWDAYSEIKVHAAGKTLRVTDSDGDAVELITNSAGGIPSGTYYFRVPLAQRGATQIVLEGPKTVAGTTVKNEVSASFTVGLGINASKALLPDWNTGSLPVGGWLRVYGSGFGDSSSDEMIVILWDGEPVRYFSGTGGGGEWWTSFPVPETEQGSHVIEVFSRKQPIDLSRPLPNTSSLSTTGRGTTNSESNGVLAPTKYSVYSQIKLYQDQDHGRPNDRITIYGTGFKANATIVTVSLTMSMYTSAPYVIPTTDASNNPVTVTNNSKGSFTASVKIPDLQGKTGPAVLKVIDSTGKSDIIQFNIDPVVLGTPTLLTPANASTFLSPRPTFTWSTVSGTAPVTYELQIDNNSDFSSPARWPRWIDDTDWTPGDALQPGIYYWRVRAVDGASRTSIGPWSSSWSFTITTIATAAGSLASGWNMISSAVLKESRKFSEMLAISDINPNIFNYNAGSGYALTDTHDLGKAYWVKANTNTLFFYEGMANPGTGNFTLALNSGWNQVGNPFVKDVDAGNIRAIRNSQTKTLTEAQDAGWIVPYIYSYNPASRSYEYFYFPTASMKPYVGYWLKANVAGVDLLFQPA